MIISRCNKLAEIMGVRTAIKQTLLRVVPGHVRCNVCGHRTRAFADDPPWHDCSKCQRCQSEIRHRLLVAMLDAAEGLQWRDLIDARDILHFAPEPTLGPLIRRRARSYVTADYLRPEFDRILDLANLDVPASSLDTLIACDVLEHVPDDRRAIREIFRVLKPGGHAVLTVPQRDHAIDTDEDATLDDPIERELRFGQRDHYRIYGDDFVIRLKDAFPIVHIIDEKAFTRHHVARNVLSPRVLCAHRLATNYRKQFFAVAQGAALKCAKRCRGDPRSVDIVAGIGRP